VGLSFPEKSPNRLEIWTYFLIIPENVGNSLIWAPFVPKLPVFFNIFKYLVLFSSFFLLVIFFFIPLF